MWSPLRVIRGRLHISHLKTTFLISSFTLRSSRSVHLDVKTLRICAFRGRSRHTCGFEPLNEFELPRKEFLAAVGADHGDTRVCSFKSTPGSENFQWVETDLGDEEMANAASRCILLHGLFEVWGHGHNVEEAAADATRAGRIPQECLQSSWSVSATSFGRLEPTRDGEKMLTEPVARALSSELRGCRTDSKVCEIRIHVIEDTCPPPPAPFFATGAIGGGGGKRGKATRSRSKEGEQNGASKSRESWCYVCRVLRLGPATGERLTMGARPRRPKAGILKALALNTRRSRGRTAIEPEIALLMANLGKVQSSSSVLDPFCGHCSLLLPAAKMGARTWGTDVAGPVVSTCERGFHAPGPDSLEPEETEESRTTYQAEQDNLVYDESSAMHARGLEAIYEDFSAFGLVMPELAMADIADESSPFRIPEFFDAIITDPPYNIKERVLLDQDERAQNTSMSMSVSTMLSPTEEDSISSRLVSPPSPRSEISEGLKCDVESVSGTAASDTSSVWNGQTTCAALALANCLVGAVVLKLVSVARCVLKPRGRLVFFLPLRGHEARLESLPHHVSEKLCEQNARGERLSLISATKQRLASQNMCRWLIVLEKESL